ncbi:YesL family protein [Radiobacillus sp. PE A8.2]|uniref:YesL family protein n=1 Tax=Radiobacillus sp. PE A8.2 TaxID=3380349 RepID=UPI00388CF346
MNLEGGWTGGFYRICEWIYRLAYLNILWLFFTLLGFIVMGIGPSTLAMYSIMRKWINGEDDFRVFPTFSSFFKTGFKQANVIGLILTIVGLFIIVDVSLLGYFDGAIQYIVVGSFTTVLILYMLVMLYIFPVVVQYENTTLQHFKSALIIGVSFPIRTLITAISVMSVLFICVIFPAVALLYLGSGFCFITMFFSHHLFKKINEQQIAGTVVAD